MLNPDRDQLPRSHDYKDPIPDGLSTSTPLALPSQQTPASSNGGWMRRSRDYASVILRHATKHTGVGMICAVAYFDP